MQVETRTAASPPPRSSHCLPVTSPNDSRQHVFHHRFANDCHYRAADIVWLDNTQRAARALKCTSVLDLCVLWRLQANLHSLGNTVFNSRPALKQPLISCPAVSTDRIAMATSVCFHLISSSALTPFLQHLGRGWGAPVTPAVDETYLISLRNLPRIAMVGACGCKSHDLYMGTAVMKMDGLD